MAINAEGDAAFTWRLLDGDGSLAQGRWRDDGGGLGSVKTLSKPGREALEPVVGLGATGNAVFAWRHLFESDLLILAKACSIAESCSSRQQLSERGAGAFDTQVDVDADSDAVVAWQRSDGNNMRIQARARSATGELGAILTLSPPGRDAFNPRVAVEADGDAIFAWEVFNGSSWVVQARTRSAAGSLSAVQNISPAWLAGQRAINPDVAVDADGDAVFTWQRRDGSTFPQRYKVQARARSATGSLSAVQTLSAPERPTFPPDVAVDADGDAVIAWVQIDEGGFEVVRARARSAAGALGAVQRISPADMDAGQLVRTAIDADGDAVIAWGGRPDGPDWILARTFSVAGALGPLQTVSPAGAGDIASGSPGLDMNAAGDAVLTWVQQQDGICCRVQTSTGP